MPIYEYECPGCGERFARLRPMREMDQPVSCPKCGRQEARRVLSLVSVAGRTASGGACAPSG